MKPDKKYMSQINLDDDDINFVPPSFNKSLFRNEYNTNTPYISVPNPSTNSNTSGPNTSTNTVPPPNMNNIPYNSGANNSTTPNMNNNNGTNVGSSNNSLGSVPSQTDVSQLYCYYNSFGNCPGQNTNTNSNQSMNTTNSKQNMSTPTPSEVLRSFDLDLDETTDLQRNYSNTDVDRIFSRIERRNPGIFATFSSYRIPYPIARVIIKRIIKLSLLYSDKKDR